MTPMRSLYVDMDSFFAAVEQQQKPSLRGKPVGITAIESESGAVVAASYEAKRYGIQTGTKIREARRRCPDIIFRPSRHRAYVKVHRHISAVIDRVAELERVRSIDEFQVALGGSTSCLKEAHALARRLKQAIRSEVGEHIGCSIGIGPNHLLAKIAGKLKKPNGLDWLAPENMPGRIAHLKLRDLPGISDGVRKRLAWAGVGNVRALYALDPRHARMIWKSVEGERFVRALQGENIPLPPARRNTFGQTKVLAPEFRRPDKARLVGRWLVEKATERLRHHGYCTREFGFQCRLPPTGQWTRFRRFGASQSTREMLEHYEVLWQRMSQRLPGHPVLSVSVQLGKLLPLSERPGEMLLPLEPGRPSDTEKLGRAIDGLNRRFGNRVITYGQQLEHPGYFERE